jgi:hypothetical protein
VTDEYYMVEFVGVKSPSILERVFNTKEEAAVYKSEHELGKFAAVITTTHLSIYQIYLQEILNVLGAQPDKRNPRGFMGCVYNKFEPEPWESERCVIGQHLFDHNIKLPVDPSRENPSADALIFQIFFRKRTLPEEILQDLCFTAREVQRIADGSMDEKPKLWSEIIPEVVEMMEGRN